jgi:hypothetical protein
LGNDQWVPDITHDILTRWTKMSEKVPSITELRFLLDDALLEEEKVPVRPEVFAHFLLSLPNDICNEEHVGILFRKSNSEISPSLQAVLTSAITNPTPPESGTENSFIALWDDNVRRILDVLMPTGTSIRDSCFSTSTHKSRPDFGFVFHNLCLFRGEEKAATTAGDPKAELCDKLAWIYSPAPYVFGEPITRPIRVHTKSYSFFQAYHAIGPHLNLCAICAPPASSTKPYVEDLAQADLRLRRGRIMHLRRMIRLSRYIQPLAGLIGDRPNPEFVDIKRWVCPWFSRSCMELELVFCADAANMFRLDQCLSRKPTMATMLPSAFITSSKFTSCSVTKLFLTLTV